MTTLTKTATGYATKDGRWTVEPITMGEGVNNNRGWSKGSREWLVTDTTGVAVLSRFGNPAQTTLHALWAARDLIDAYNHPGG